MVIVTCQGGYVFIAVCWFVRQQDHAKVTVQIFMKS